MLQKESEFKDLFVLLTLTDSQDIPRFLFEAVKSKEIVENFIKELNHYSLIVISNNNHKLTSLSIHRSTQEMMLAYLIRKLNLTRNEQRVQKLFETLENLIDSSVKQEYFPGIRSLISHIEALLKQRLFLNEEQKAYLKCELAGFYILLSDYAKALTITEEAYNILFNIYKTNKNPNKAYLKLAKTLYYKSVIATRLGNFKDAILYIKDSLEIYKKYFPTQYMQVSAGLGMLGEIESCLGNYKEAAQYLEECLALMDTHYPKENIIIANNLNKLGNIYCELGNLAKAKNILEEAARRLPPTSVKLISMNLGYQGDMYKNLGDYIKAEELLKKAKNLHLIHFPERYNHIAWISINLANVFIEKGDYDKAETELNESLQLCHKYLSLRHPHFFLIKYYLGKLYQALGFTLKAKAYLEESLRYYEQTFGKGYIKTACIIRSLAKVHLAQGEIKIAEGLLNHSLRILEENKHPTRYMDLECLAEVYLEKAKITPLHTVALNKQAQHYLQQALEIIQISFSTDSPHFSRVKSKMDSVVASLNYKKKCNK